jgi:hypothetical protein
MKIKTQKIATSKEEIQRKQIVNSLVSSFRIENINISKKEAATILKKVETRIKK